MSKREHRRTGEVRLPGHLSPEDASGTEAGDTCVERMRRREDDDGPPTRAAGTRDYGAAKHLAFERGNPAAAVRAIELQQRALATQREHDVRDAKRLSDDQLIAAIARGDPMLEERLRARLKKGT